MIDIKKLYNTRFTALERVKKQKLWKILCQDFLQQFIKKSDTVVDVGAGQCEFINNISCRKKIVIDINPTTKAFADPDVQVVISSIKHIKKSLCEGSVDVIFMSNLLEHLDSKEEVFRLLYESYLVLRKGGRLLIMQPDIGLVGHAYWDFFDHKVPLTCASLTEVLLANQFRITFLRSPFLPYSTKLKYLPLWPFLFKIYLHVRPLHFFFGKQFFVCAQK